MASTPLAGPAPTAPPARPAATFIVGYQPTVVLGGGEPVPVPTRVDQDFHVTVADLERARTPRTKAVLLGYPNNPTGAVLERSRLEEIARWAIGHDLLVIADEIY